jgi:nucleoside-diphosphate-sugar epimerase
MLPYLQQDGHRVVGLDSFFFEACHFGDDDVKRRPKAVRCDIRDVTVEQLRGFDAIVHLANLSNDPLGALNAEVTYQINFAASARLARLARRAGVSRFVFASSCSLYGVSDGDSLLAEDAAFNPVTPYGVSKVRFEEEVSELADDLFSPVFMRNATVYGVSPSLRADIVVNNLVGLAHTRGEIVLTSDGSPWRPLVHVEDVCRAFATVLEAPRELVHDQAFNVGSTDENYRVRDLAELTAEAMPGASISIGGASGPDPRNYRVDCSKLVETLPAARPRWTVPRGIAELRDAYRAHDLSREDFENRHVRLRHIKALLRGGRLDGELRWIDRSRSRAGASPGPAMPLGGGGLT